MAARNVSVLPVDEIRPVATSCNLLGTWKIGRRSPGLVQVMSPGGVLVALPHPPLMRLG